MRNNVICVTLIVLVILVGSMPIIERFTITDEKSGYIVFQDSVKKYKDFYISFTHSVNKTPVNEYYSIVEGKLVLEKATFYSYGAGMPEAGEYGSSKPSVVNGVVQLNNIHKEFKRFTYYAGTYADHRLNAGDTEILFSQLVKPQTPVTFEVKKISMITLGRLYWTRI